jgi:glutaredoxin
MIKNFFNGIIEKETVELPAPKETTLEQFDMEAFQMSDDIKVYALSTCIHCRNAKKYLDECGVKYKCVHVDELKGEERKTVVQEIKTHNPSVSFPTIVIRNTVVVGFHKDKIDKALKG